MPFATPFFVADVLPSTSWKKSPAIAMAEGETAAVDVQDFLDDKSATPGGPAQPDVPKTNLGQVPGPAKSNPELAWERNADPWDPATRALPSYKAYTTNQLQELLAKKQPLKPSQLPNPTERWF